jgi:hypothetical protein
VWVRCLQGMVRLPSSLGSWLALPGNQKLHHNSMMDSARPAIENLLRLRLNDSLSVYGGKVRDSFNRAAKLQLKLRNVENRVEERAFRKIQTIGYSAHLLKDLEGTIETWRELEVTTPSHQKLAIRLQP